MAAEGKKPGPLPPDIDDDQVNAGYAKNEQTKETDPLKKFMAWVLVALALIAVFGPLHFVSSAHPSNTTLPANNTSSAMLNGNAVSAMPHSVTNTWVYVWIGVVIALCIFIVLLGIYAFNHPLGIFINERNIMSLSRIQITLWTVIIVSALLIMVIVRFVYGEPDPFAIIIDWHVWAVLGLSATAAVGSPVINSGKSLKEPIPTESRSIPDKNRKFDQKGAKAAAERATEEAKKAEDQKAKAEKADREAEAARQEMAAAEAAKKQVAKVQVLSEKLEKARQEASATELAVKTLEASAVDDTDAAAASGSLEAAGAARRNVVKASEDVATLVKELAEERAKAEAVKDKAEKAGKTAEAARNAEAAAEKAHREADEQDTVAKTAKDTAEEAATEAAKTKNVTYSKSVSRAAQAFNQHEDDVEQARSGVLYGNKNPADARFSDIFEGDELDNAMYIDVSKMQMFWFTVIAIGGYAILVWGMFLNNSPVDLGSFPAFSDGLVAILAVSHATYLGGKGFTQTKSTS